MTLTREETEFQALRCYVQMARIPAGSLLTKSPVKDLVELNIFTVIRDNRRIPELDFINNKLDTRVLVYKEVNSFGEQLVDIVTNFVGVFGTSEIRIQTVDSHVKGNVVHRVDSTEKLNNTHLGIECVSILEHIA